MDNSSIQTIYVKKNGGLGTKSTKQIASINDLNNFVIKKLNENVGEIPVIFYHRYRFIRLKEGIYKRCSTNSCISYEKIQDLNDLDYQVIAQERQDAINHAIQRHERRNAKLQEVI